MTTKKQMTVEEMFVLMKKADVQKTLKDILIAKNDAVKGFEKLNNKKQCDAYDKFCIYAITDYIQEFNIIKNALEKQMPEKYKRSCKYDTSCSVCGEKIDNKYTIDGFEIAGKYCPNCGQAIDWSDYE